MEAVRLGACVSDGSGGRQLAGAPAQGNRKPCRGRRSEIGRPENGLERFPDRLEVNMWRPSGDTRSLWFRSRAAVSRRADGVNQRTPKMYDQTLFLETLSRFAVVLPARYDLEAALSELTESVTSVLGLAGSGVTMAEEGRLRFVTAVSQASGELERNQEEQQAGPCRDAYDTGEVVRVTDVRAESTRWPEFSATAVRLAVAGVAGVPMRLDDQIIGALNLYSGEPRQWPDEDVAVRSEEH